MLKLIIKQEGGLSSIPQKEGCTDKKIALNHFRIKERAYGKRRIDIHFTDKEVLQFHTELCKLIARKNL